MWKQVLAVFIVAVGQIDGPVFVPFVNRFNDASELTSVIRGKYTSRCSSAKGAMPASIRFSRAV